MPPAAVGLQEYITGSSSQPPGASVQGIIAGGGHLEVAILVECVAVWKVQSGQQYRLSKEQAMAVTAC